MTGVRSPSGSYTGNKLSNFTRRYIFPKLFSQEARKCRSLSNSFRNAGCMCFSWAEIEWIGNRADVWNKGCLFIYLYGESPGTTAWARSCDVFSSDLLPVRFTLRAWFVLQVLRVRYYFRCMAQIRRLDHIPPVLATFKSGVVLWNLYLYACSSVTLSSSSLQKSWPFGVSF